MKVDDLRSELHGHAEHVEDAGAPARSAAVRARVGVVRRRRRAAAAATLALVVVAGGATIVSSLTPSRPDAAGAPSDLAGRTVPQTQTATGFTYRYVRGVQSEPGAARLTVNLPASDRPRLVMWATSDAGRRPVVRLHQSQTGREADSLSVPGGFDRFELVNPGLPSRVTVSRASARPHHRLALAFFDLSAKPPPGVSNGALTFRRTVLEDRLLGARIGAPGVTDLRMRVRVPASGALSFTSACYGSNVMVTVTAMRASSTGRCSQAPTWDAGGSGSFSFRLPPGRVVTVRTHTVRSFKDPAVVPAPRAVLAVGVYTDRGRTERVAGTDVPVALQQDGHEYVLRRTAQSEAGSRSLRLELPASSVPRAVTLVVSRSGARTSVTATAVRHEAGGDVTEQGSGISVVSGGSLVERVIQPGAPVTLTVRSSRPSPRILLGLGVSDLVH